MNDPGEIVGMVDVLKLTYATLEQVSSLSSSQKEGRMLTSTDQHYVDRRRGGSSMGQILVIAR